MSTWTKVNLGRVLEPRMITQTSRSVLLNHVDMPVFHELDVGACFWSKQQRKLT